MRTRNVLFVISGIIVILLITAYFLTRAIIQGSIGNSVRQIVQNWNIPAGAKVRIDVVSKLNPGSKFDEEEAGTFKYRNYYEEYSLNVTNNENLKIELWSSNFQPVIILVLPDLTVNYIMGQTISNAETGIKATNFSGIIKIRAANFKDVNQKGEFGQYRLRVMRLSNQ